MFPNAATQINLSNTSQPGATEPQQTAKKRGRKKGSKGVDSRLSNAGNLSQSQQSSQYGDSISFQSLKNKIDLIRGASGKKIKTTHELLAELQSRKLSGVDANSLIGGGIGSNYGSQTSSPVLPSIQQPNIFVPSPSSCSGK